ncbi:SIMPL domain-containing protein [Ferdinandcohnia quinoae]|uniref:SIMPL domain-containing protein n=1 Tax=Fredinandcohnia quinoae TaxID=2918902 RepID=A0AAW5E604_9BACI|nr:SIMPL domain-containing protein [Fredinandcohnia sp. SECRCQ15]MCH1625482.1 SIMPL domain-containing protein [Fredinandcohnia sp. SECRCQ15]
MYNQLPWLPTTSYRNPHIRNDNNLLKLTGEGSVSANPDMSTITLGVITENENLTTAQQENNQKVASVIHSLSALGIQKENIKTVDYRVEMVYDYENSKQTLRGYRVIHMLQITNNDLARTGMIVDTAIKNGANSVTSIDFSVKNPQNYYSQALALALNNAQAKATALANEMGVKVNIIPILVQEVSQMPPPMPFQATMFAKSEAATPIQPGELKITATIHAHFSYFLLQS